MQANQLCQGVIVDYHQHPAKVLECDNPHHNATINLLDSQKTIVVDMDELTEEPQAHSDSYSYY